MPSDAEYISRNISVLDVSDRKVILIYGDELCLCLSLVLRRQR